MMQKISELLGELMKEAYNCKKHDIFINYMPHIEGIEVRIFLNHWTTDAEKDYGCTIYLDSKGAKTQLKEIIKYIKYLGGKQ